MAVSSLVVVVRSGGCGRGQTAAVFSGSAVFSASVERREVALGVQRGGAAGAGRGDRLAVGVVDDVAGGEDTGDVGPGAGRVDLEVALVVQVEQALEELGARVVADRDEQAGDRQLGGLAGLACCAASGRRACRSPWISATSLSQTNEIFGSAKARSCIALEARRRVAAVDDR